MKNFKNYQEFCLIESWHRLTSSLLVFVMMLNLFIPFTVNAAIAVNRDFYQTEVDHDQFYEPTTHSDFAYKKTYLVTTSQRESAKSIADFFNELVALKSPALPAKSLVPIMVSDITIFVPTDKLGKQIGDAEVQARLVRSQIYNTFSRNTIKPGISEQQQIRELYEQAARIAAQGKVVFGEEVPDAVVEAFGHNFIWPVKVLVNNQTLLVPQVYFTNASVNDLAIRNHLVEFHGATAEFRDIVLNSGALVNVRDSFLRARGNFTIAENAKIFSDTDDLNIVVHGTLQNLSGTVSAAKNINILASQISSKRVVHRFDTGVYQGARLGEVASFDAGGDIQIKTYGDMQFESSALQAGGSIKLKADGNIRIAAQQETVVGGKTVGGYNQSQSAISYIGSTLNAKDSVFLMASGAIEINASTLHADTGVINILAQQGVYIGNEMDQFQQARQGKMGKVTEQEQQLQTMAVRSALNAGKSVLVATDFGDITLKATAITSNAGTEITARNGKLNLLLAKEQDEYFFHKVKKGTWKIKTETKQDQTDTAVYNAIVGGVKVNATRGVTLELAQKEGQTINQVMGDMAATSELAWMNTLYNSPEYSGNVELAYQTLQDLHLHKKTSNLSPAAMAVIAIAVAVAMGPAGAGWTGAEGSLAIKGINTAALQAGATTLATQAATNLANGLSLGETLEAMVQEDSIRSLAISMVTAGVLDHFGDTLNQDFFGSVPADGVLTTQQQMISFANQAAQTLATSTVSVGLSTIINGGSFADFSSAMKSSLYQAGVMAVGKHMAQAIGKSYYDKDINQTVRYIAHAGAGCIIGIASSETGGTQGSGSESCLTGSVGAVTGELVADIYKAKKIQGIFDKYKDKISALRNNEQWSQADIDAFLLSNAVQGNINYEIAQMKAVGIDLAKLSGALSALAGGGDVNLAAMTAENAAKNNAFFLVPLAIVMLKGIDIALTVSELYDIYELLRTDPTKGDVALRKYIREQIEGGAIKKAIPGFKTFDELLDWCKKNEVFSADRVDDIKKYIQSNSKADAPSVDGKVVHTSKHKADLNDTEGFSASTFLTNLKTSNHRNDGKLGEQLAIQIIEEITGIKFKGLTNGSGNGSDGFSINPDPNKKEIWLLEVKSSVKGEFKNPSKLDLLNRGEKWIREAATGKIAGKAVKPEDVAFANDLLILMNKGYKIKPFYAEVSLPPQGQSGTARTTITPWK